METTGVKEKVIVRNLRPEDLDAVILTDAKLTGRRREEFFKLKLQQNLVESGIKISLAAELDGAFCGFLQFFLSHGLECKSAALWRQMTYLTGLTFVDPFPRLP